MLLRPVDLSPVMLLGRRQCRVLFLGTDDHDAARWLTGAGAEVFGVEDIYNALFLLNEDPADWSLLVIDAQSCGGVAAVRRALRLLDERAQRVPVILYGDGLRQHSFPAEPGVPVELTQPANHTLLKGAVGHLLGPVLDWAETPITAA